MSDNSSDDIKKIKNNTYHAEYYANHKDEINKKITCEICKAQVLKSNKSTHEKSKKHMNVVNIIKIKQLENELISQKIKCDICDKQYMKKDEGEHNKSRRHVDAVKIIELMEINEQLKK